MNILNRIARLERELLLLRQKHKNGILTTEERQACAKVMKRIEKELIGLRIHTFVSDKMIY